MSLTSNSILETQELARKAQQGDPAALAAIRDHCHSALVRILLARGVNPTEAEDLLADLWSDCVPGDDRRPSLLAKFGGRSSLLSWLARVAGNRWIDLKRRGARLAAPGETDLDELPGCLSELKDDALLELLRECVRTAFFSCPAEILVFLRLVYLHGLTQREVGRMMGWSESKTSRNLAEAMERIKKTTLAELRRRDAGLELSWEDFLGLCGTEDSDFS